MLATVLRLNALSCAVFGLIFVVDAPAVSAFLGEMPVWILRGLGIVLIGNALHLAYTAQQAAPPRIVLRYFALGDGVWALASVLLVLSGLWITTPVGIAITLVTAGMTGSFGLLQWQAGGLRDRPETA